MAERMFTGQYLSSETAMNRRSGNQASETYYTTYVDRIWQFMASR